jgi:hypothetical protein
MFQEDLSFQWVLALCLLHLSFQMALSLCLVVQYYL